MKKLFSLLIISSMCLFSVLGLFSCSSTEKNGKTKETQIDISELPAPILEHIEFNYPGSKIVEAEIEEEAGKKNYEVDIVFDETDVELEFSMEGELLEQEINDD